MSHREQEKVMPEPGADASGSETESASDDEQGAGNAVATSSTGAARAGGSGGAKQRDATAADATTTRGRKRRAATAAADARPRKHSRFIEVRQQASSSQGKDAEDYWVPRMTEDNLSDVMKNVPGAAQALVRSVCNDFDDWEMAARSHSAPRRLVSEDLIVQRNGTDTALAQALKSVIYEETRVAALRDAVMFSAPDVVPMREFRQLLEAKGVKVTHTMSKSAAERIIQLRAAYDAEMNKIESSQMLFHQLVLQTMGAPAVAALVTPLPPYPLASPHVVPVRAAVQDTFLALAKLALGLPINTPGTGYASAAPIPSSSSPSSSTGTGISATGATRPPPTVTAVASSATAGANQGVGKRGRDSLGPASAILNNWFFAHLDNPYPDPETKKDLAKQCSMTLVQINNWFGNRRIRYKRRLAEESQLQEMQGLRAAQQAAASGMGADASVVPTSASM